jgi:hypothetical protein
MQVKIQGLCDERNRLKKEEASSSEGAAVGWSELVMREQLKWYDERLAGGMAMRTMGVPVGLPCLAEPIAQRQIPN